MNEFLRVENITKYYGEFAANKNINLSINEGSIHAIVGENGAGKSTLMNILAGVIQQSEGKIFLRGNEIKLRNPNDATKNRIGMVQQEFMLFEDLTVLENIVMGHEDTQTLGLLDLNTSKKKILEICELYNFKFPLDRKVSTLPIAIQQQVEIVKVLYKDADIIILDEPTSVLTPQGIEGLFKAMKFLIKNGKTILFITHKLKEVLEISDRISVLKDGKLVSTVNTSDVNEKMLAELMVGREVFLDIERNLQSQNDVLYKVEHLVIHDEKGQLAINDVSFEIKYGEVVGIVGIAGNGQSELIESLFGLRKLTSGTIEFEGNHVESYKPYDYRLNHIGYIPQDRRGTGSSITSNLVDNAIMGKHLTAFCRNGIINYELAKEFSSSVVNRFNVRTRNLDTLAGSLSGGNLQKLIVGREMSQNAKLLIIEDPTRGIDIGSMEFIWNEIVKNSEVDNNSSLLVSYDLSEAMALSDRLLVLNEGRIVKEFQRKDFDEKAIGFYMLGGTDTYETNYQ